MASTWRGTRRPPTFLSRDATADAVGIVSAGCFAASGHKDNHDVAAGRIGIDQPLRFGTGIGQQRRDGTIVEAWGHESCGSERGARRPACVSRRSRSPFALATSAATSGMEPHRSGRGSPKL